MDSAIQGPSGTPSRQPQGQARHYDWAAANRALTASEVSATARLFSASVIRELASGGRSSLLARLAKESGLAATSNTVGQLFEAAFTVLQRKANRHEYVYKSALTQKVLLGRHSLRTASMLTEFRVGKAKADVVILNGTSTVYEIKSERDNLDRLQHQLASYQEVFDRVNVLTSEEHAAAVEALAPSTVGILVLTSRFHISTRRPAHSDHRRIQPTSILDSLQRAEARLVLERCGVAVPELPNTRVYQAMTGMFAQLDPIKVRAAVSEVLKVTRSPVALGEFVGALPASLQAAALSTQLSASERVRLVQSTKTPLKDALNWA